MKKIIALALFTFALTACSPAMTKQIAKSAIDIVLATCIAENADIMEEAELHEVCKWTDEAAPMVKDLLAARAKGLAKAAASAPKCPDADTAGK